MIRRPPRSTLDRSSAASDVYKRQVHPASDVGNVLGWKPLRWIGIRSYGIYLWHYPIFCFTRPVLDFTWFFHLSGWPVFALRIVLTFGAAALSYHYVEQPIRH